MTWKPRASRGNVHVAPDHISDGIYEFLVYSAIDMCELLNMREQVAKDEIERLDQRVQELDQRFRVCNSMLIESQTIEAKLREALKTIEWYSPGSCWALDINMVEEALALPTDDTAV